MENFSAEEPVPTLAAVHWQFAIVALVIVISSAPDNVARRFVTATAQSVAGSPHPAFVPSSGYKKVQEPIVNVFEMVHLLIYYNELLN